MRTKSDLDQQCVSSVVQCAYRERSIDGAVCSAIDRDFDRPRIRRHTTLGCAVIYLRLIPRCPVTDYFRITGNSQGPELSAVLTNIAKSVLQD